MSYVSSRKSYSGLGSSYSYYMSSHDYSSSSYDSLSSWRKTSAPSYSPRTYDFGTSSFLSKNYGGSGSYSRKYDEYSWKAKDLLTDNPANAALDVKMPEHETLKYEFVNGEDATKDDELTADIENEENASTDVNKSYSSKHQYNIDEGLTKDDTRADVSSDLSNKRYSSYSSETYSTSKKVTSDEGSTKDYTRISSDLSSNRSDSRNNYTNRDNYRDYSSKKFSKEETDDLTLIRGYSREQPANRFSNKDEKSEDINTNYNSKYSSYKELTKPNDDKLLTSGTTHGRATTLTKKKLFSLEEEEDDVFVKEENEKSLCAEKESIFDDKKIQPSTKLEEEANQPRRKTGLLTGNKDSTCKSKAAQDTSKSNETGAASKNFDKPKESKASGDVTEACGPLRIHRQGITKFISAIPDEKLYISSVNFLTDRIELRFCGAPLKETKMRKCRSITDLYDITVRPQEQQDLQKPAKHPWEDTIQCTQPAKHPREDTIQCTQQDFSYSYDSENEILHYNKSQHEHTKEMYITQYTHHFDSNQPRTHIAAWKIDFEPNEIPHEKSRMCVVRSPVVGDFHRRVPRPKSAPPQLTRPGNPDGMSPLQKVQVVERGHNTLPRLRRDRLAIPELEEQQVEFGGNYILSRRRNRPAIPEEFIVQTQKVDVVEPLSGTPGNMENLFQSSMDDSPNEDASSVGYVPSDDDTSDSSAFFFNDSRFHSRYHYDNQHRDPANLSFSKPKLIRLSAEYPGIRNLEKMRRKRQSMGSATSSGGSLSSVGGVSPSPRNGEYGFFVAVTSGDPQKPRVRREHRYSYA